MVVPGVIDKIDFEAEKPPVSTVQHRLYNNPEFNKDEGLRPISECDVGEGVLERVLYGMDWEPNTASNDREVKEVSTFNGKYYYISSKPAYWHLEGDDFQLVDTVVISSDRDEAIRLFEEEVKTSERIKAERQEKASEMVEMLSKIPEFKTVIGRGSIYDERRMANEWDDTDIVILGNWNPPTLYELIDKFKKIGATDWCDSNKASVYAWGFFGDYNETHDIAKHDGSKLKINLDCIPITFEMIQMLWDNPDIAKGMLGSEYLRDMFKNAVMLNGDEELLVRVQKLCDMVDKIPSN